MERIFLSDLSYTTAQGLTSEFIPYGVGCIKSYFCEHAHSRDQFEVVLFQDPERFIERFLEDPPAVVAFSNYSWNRELSYALAREAKRRRPETLVVFGGPNYPLEDPLREQLAPAASTRWTCTSWARGKQPFANLIDAWAELPRHRQDPKRAGIEGCHALVDGKLFKSSDVTPRLPAPRPDFESPYVVGYPRRVPRLAAS